jgi:hypothetical protein
MLLRARQRSEVYDDGRVRRGDPAVQRHLSKLYLEMPEHKKYSREGLEALIGLVDHRFTVVDQRFAMVDQRFTMVDHRFTLMDYKIDRLGAEIAELRADMGRMFAAQTEALRADMRVMWEAIDARLPAKPG